MKIFKAFKITQLIYVTLLFFILSACQQGKDLDKDNKPKVLRHIVLLKLADSTSVEDVTLIEHSFAALPSKIPEISDFEWGLNNSKEGLDMGFTHSFLVSFDSEEDRAVYLPHPDHAAFVEILKPHLEEVLVVDYWTTD